MSITFPEILKTGFEKTQKIIALKYIEQLNAKLMEHDDISSLVGYRHECSYERNGEYLEDKTYPFSHLGKSIVLNYEFILEKIWFELIGDVNSYVVYINVINDNDFRSIFFFEFDKDDNDFLNTISPKVIKLLEE
jgi:hypothetical protein